MIIQSGDQTYRVTWNHEQAPTFTRCIIKDDASKVVLSEGYAALSPRDTYNRNTGRKVALAYALDNLAITDRAFRRKFYEAYHAMRGRW